MSGTQGLITMALAVGLAAGFAAPPGPSAAPHAPPAAPQPQIAAADHVVRVYYFHTTQRCASCRKVETLSAESIRAGFERELGDGRLEFESLNIDEPTHRHFVKDYALYTKSLVVVDRIGDREARWKNLPKIWELLRDEAAFREYVRSEVRAYLERRP